MGSGSKMRLFRWSSLSRLHGMLAVAALVALVATFAAGGAGAAQSRSQASGPSSATAQYGHLVKICHNGKTIEVNSKSASAFVAQGDTLGACKTQVAAAQTTTTTSAQPTFVAHVAPKTTG